MVVNQEGGPGLKRARWGLVPSWAKDERIGNSLINARSETVGVLRVAEIQREETTDLLSSEWTPAVCFWGIVGAMEDTGKGNRYFLHYHGATERNGFENS